MNTQDSPFPSESWLKIIKLWVLCQTEMAKILRWQEPVEIRGERRTQNSLEHTYALTWLVVPFAAKLSRYVKLDIELLLLACLVHDQGEGFTSRDILWTRKTETHDLEEYLAFTEAYKKCKLPEQAFRLFQRAFLLQFALSKPKSFPADARKIMADLVHRKRYEALAFKALENWDYFMYAVEQYQEKKNLLLLPHIIKHHCEIFNELARDLPGFGQMMWTKKMREWCVKFKEDHPPKE